MRHILSKDIDMIAVGNRLRDLIQLQYPSVVDFADAIGVSRNTMYRLLNKGEFPCVPVLVDICACLGCSVDFLLGLSSAESDAREAYISAVLNIQAFRSKWTSEERIALAADAAGLLTESQENRIMHRVQAGFKGPLLVLNDRQKVPY